MKEKFSCRQSCTKLIILAVAAYIATACSCNQPKTICKANCYSLKFSGKVINGLTNGPVANVRFIVEWQRNIGWNLDNRIAEFRTGADGTFNTAADIDTGRLHQDYRILLYITNPGDYLMKEYTASMYDSLAPAAFTDLSFTVYPKVPLTIKLNRNQKDSFRYFGIEYYFIDGNTHNAFSTSAQQEVKESEVKVFTCPDLFTKIAVYKEDLNGVMTTTIDSVKCTKGKKNIYTVNY